MLIELSVAVESKTAIEAKLKLRKIGAKAASPIIAKTQWVVLLVVRLQGCHRWS